MKKKLEILIVLVLALVLVLSMDISAASYKDLDGHWAKDYVDDKLAIELFDEHGEVYGANDVLTRAEVLKAINKLTRINKESKIDFDDIDKDDTYYTEFKKAAYTGFIGLKSKKAEPKRLVSRAEAVHMLALVYGIDAKDSANAFTDLEGISEAGYIDAFKALGVISGYPDGKFKPKDAIKRAEFTAMVSALYARFAAPLRYPASYKNTDKTKLKSLLIHGSTYANEASENEKNEYKLAYANAKLILNNKKAIQVEVDLACEKLSNAIDALNKDYASQGKKVELKEDMDERNPKSDLKNLVYMSEALEKKLDLEYYKINYERALKDFKETLAMAKQVLDDEFASMEAIAESKAKLEDKLDGLYASNNELEEIKDAATRLKDLIKDKKDDKLEELIKKAQMLIISKPMHQCVDEMILKLNDAIIKVLDELDDKAAIEEMVKEALENLEDISKGRIFFLEDRSYTLMRTIRANKDKDGEESKETLLNALKDASKVKEDYDTAIEELKDMQAAADDYEGLLADLGLNEKNSDKLAAIDIIKHVKGVAASKSKITDLDKISQLWDKLDSIDELLKDEMALDDDLRKLEDFISLNKLKLKESDTALIDEADEMLGREKLSDEELSAKKKELEELLAKLYKAVISRKDAEDTLKTAEAIIKENATYKAVLLNKEALKAALSMDDERAITKANEELKKEIARLIPIKLIYQGRDIEGETISFDMKSDMSVDEVRRLVYPMQMDKSALSSSKMKLSLGEGTKQDLAVRNAKEEIVTFRKPSMKDKIRIKFTYNFAGKAYECTLEYRSEDKAKRFKNIIGIYRALEGESIDEKFFKNYEGGEAKLFDIAKGEDASGALKVKILKDGELLSSKDTKLSKGVYDVIFYYLDDAEEVSASTSSKLIVDEAISTKDLLYVYDGDNASYIIPTKDTSGNIIFGFKVKERCFAFPKTVKIFSQDSGVAFLNKDSKAELGVKFIDASGKELSTRADALKVKEIFLVLLEDAEGSLGDRNLSLKKGERYQVPIIK